MARADITLVLGGARSGKSAYAETLAADAAERLVYIATAEAVDAEMAERIADHRARRGPEWTTVEEPLDLADALARSDATDTVILVDCLTLWLGNLMAAERDVAAEIGRLMERLDDMDAQVVLVANEVGLGIVPDNGLARAYRDLHGTLNQVIAAAADRVVFVAAGLPMLLKGEPG